MFKCKECGAEYEVKPDYCDCGNDEFEQIETKPQPSQETVKKNIQETTPNLSIPKISSILTLKSLLISFRREISGKLINDSHK